MDIPLHSTIPGVLICGIVFDKTAVMYDLSKWIALHGLHNIAFLAALTTQRYLNCT